MRSSEVELTKSIPLCKLLPGLRVPQKVSRIIQPQAISPSPLEFAIKSQSIRDSATRSSFLSLFGTLLRLHTTCCHHGTAPPTSPSSPACFTDARNGTVTTRTPMVPRCRSDPTYNYSRPNPTRPAPGEASPKIRPQALSHVPTSAYCLSRRRAAQYFLSRSSMGVGKTKDLG